MLVLLLRGLISRYYLEVLDGWRNCKALITFGTPHRGFVNALDYLANGYKKLFLDLTDAMRSFASVYQLLPVYPCLDVDGRQLRVAEFDRIPEKIDCGRAEQALKFHREIEEAVNNHQQDVDYLKNGYKILPTVGTRQPTLQSALFDEGKLTASRRLLPGISKILEDGDGTVPRLSAIPIEMSEEYRDTYVPERHGVDQARWRGLWRMRIQEYLTCAVQNIQVLITKAVKPKTMAAAKAYAVETARTKPIRSLDCDRYCCILWIPCIITEECRGLLLKPVRKTRFGQQPVNI